MAKHYTNFIDELRDHTQRLKNEGLTSATFPTHLLKRIVEFEVAEGGPYAIGGNRGVPDFEMNFEIARFLQAFGVRLPKLDDYLDRTVVGGGENVRKEYEKFVRQRFQISKKDEQPALSKCEERMIDLIRDHAKERFTNLSPEMRKSAEHLIDRTIEGNTDRQMTLMPYFMREALGEKGKSFEDDCIAKLGLANVFFWSAFIAYDDFWDEDESAQPRLLPVANLFARHFVDFFATYFNADVRIFFHHLMDLLDGANAQEIAHFRLRREGSLVYPPSKFPDYGDFSIKFYPAAGHTIAALSMLSVLNHDSRSENFRNMLSYFKHYLIAMQINDDAHDWKEDLARGHLSTALSLLLNDWRANHPTTDFIDLHRDLPELEHLFWFHTLRSLCEIVQVHTKISRRALASVTLIENRAPLEQFITRPEASASRALEEQRNSLEIIRVFS